MCSARPALQPYFRQIVMTLLTRMQQNKMNNYVYYFVYFCCTCLRSMQTASLRIIPSKLSMRSNHGNILVVTCVPSRADPCAQTVVANRDQLRRAVNFAVSPDRPQYSSRRPSTSPHTKHTLPKRAQPKNMVRLTSLAPHRPLTQTLRQL